MGIVIMLLIITSPLLTMGIGIYALIKGYLKKIEKQKQEYRNYPSVRVELHDLLFVIKKINNKSHDTPIAVYKNRSNNKYYVVGLATYLANPLVSYIGHIKKPPEIIVQSHNKNRIEPQDKGTLYIAKELGNVSVNGDSVTIGNETYNYKGSIHVQNVFQTSKSFELRNSVVTNKILDEINNATIIDGLIEFDIDKY